MHSCTVFIEGKKYEGEYSVEDNVVEVDVCDYTADMSDFFKDMKVKYLELSIFDYRNKLFIFSSAFYMTETQHDVKQYVKFQAKAYYKTEKFQDAVDFELEKAEYKSVTFYHPMLNHFFTNPCLKITVEDDVINSKLFLKSEIKEIDINKNNIQKIEFGGKYSYSINRDGHSLNIDTENYAEIYFISPIKEDDLFEYIREFNIYVNAYCPQGLRAHRIFVNTVDDKSYSLRYKQLGTIDYVKRRSPIFIKMTFFEFIGELYKTCDYRGTQNRNRYILFDFKKPTSLEDQFTYYYRYIDLYMGEYIYSQTGKKPSNYERLSQFIDNNLGYFDAKDIAEIDNLKHEMNSLRNHYIHEGYYLPNEAFQVTGKKGKLLYTKKLDYEWLYRVSRAMQYGAYKILYKDILKIDIDEGRFKSTTLI